MKIQFKPYQNFNSRKSNNAQSIKYNYNLSHDTVSFGAIKKSSLNPYQLLCSNYFKAPLEKFKLQEDFRNWSKNELNETLDLSKYNAIDELDTEERINRLVAWKDFLLTDREMKNHPELALVIANSLTKDLYFDTKNFPPVFDKGAVRATVSDIDRELNKNPKYTTNFKNKYQENLKTNVLNNVEIIKDRTSKRSYWVKIPSELNDRENFEKNVKDLNILSCESWCTKGHFAKTYLKNNDFYLYMEHNSPELSLRVENSTIKEVRDRNHNSQIHLGYFEPLTSIIKQEGLEGLDSELQNLEFRKSMVDFAKNLMKDDIADKNYVNILKSAGIDVTVLEDGTLELSHFKKADKYYTYQDLGINENEMFKHISVIKGNADFADTEVTNLGSLKSIGGYVFLGMSKLNDLGNVEISQRVFRD